jgi:hypothetical protein
MSRPAMSPPARPPPRTSQPTARRGLRGVRAARLAGPRPHDHRHGPGGSPSGRRSARSRSAWPGKSPTTCWPRPGWHGHRGRSPRSCRACRSWSWAWGPLAHMLRAGAETADTPDSGTGQPAVLRPLPWSPQDQDGPGRRRPEADRDRPARQDQNGPEPGPHHGHGITGPGPRPTQPQMDQARAIARRLAVAATGKPVSRRALRSGGVTGSNQTLNALARMINTELAGYAGSR